MDSMKDIKIIGAVAKSIIENIRYDDTVKDILLSHNIKEFSDTEWYPVFKIKEILEEIIIARHSFDSVFDMVAIGLEGTKNMPMPDGISFEEFINNQQVTIEQIYSGEPKVKVDTIKLGENHYQVEIYLPWPSDLLYGNYYGFAKRLLPEKIQFTISKHPDYREGDIPIIFDITWGE